MFLTDDDSWLHSVGVHPDARGTAAGDTWQHTCQTAPCQSDTGRMYKMCHQSNITPVTEYTSQPSHLLYTGYTCQMLHTGCAGFTRQTSHQSHRGYTRYTPVRSVTHRLCWIYTRQTSHQSQTGFTRCTPVRSVTQRLYQVLHQSDMVRLYREFACQMS